MPQKSKIDCAALFPKIAAIIRKDGRDIYLNHWDIAQRLRDDDFVQSLATATRHELDVGSKAVVLFGAQYTRKPTKFGMARYRRYFSRKREGGCWPYKVSENWVEKRERCYLREENFQLTDEVFRTGLLYGKISI